MENWEQRQACPADYVADAIDTHGYGSPEHIDAACLREDGVNPDCDLDAGHTGPHLWDARIDDVPVHDPAELIT